MEWLSLEWPIIYLIRSCCEEYGYADEGDSRECRTAVGLGIVLKDGDVVLFGTDSKVHVEVRPCETPIMTVPTWIESTAME